jgi:DNA primase
VGFIPEEVISQVIDRSDIVEVISGYIPLKRAGRNFKALCPFHNEKTSSFVVNPDKQIFRCFGCGVGGNALTFVMKHERMDFPEAVRFLAAKANIAIPEERPQDKAKSDLRQTVIKANEIAVEYFHDNLLSGKDDEVLAARDYLRKRKVNAECARRFKLGYATSSWDGLLSVLKQKGFSDKFIEKAGLAVKSERKSSYYDRFRQRVIFPIFDHRNRPVAFGGRTMKKDERAKYLNSPETPVYTKGEHLYGFNWAKAAVEKEDSVVIVEGYMDFLRPFHEGVENVAASCGTALTSEQIRLLRRYTKNIIMLFDMDTAGQSATLRSLDLLLEEDMSVRVATLADDEDPDSFILKYGIEAFKKSLKDAQNLFDFKLANLVSQHNAATIEGRAKICQEIIPTIEKVRSEVMRDGYLQELAQKLRVKEEVVLRERQRLLKKATGRPVVVQDEAAEPKGSRNIRQDERMLLKLMLQSLDWVRVAHQNLTVEDFQDRLVRSVVEKLYELFEAEKEISLAGLISFFENDEVRSFLTACADDEPLKGDQEQIFDDCLRRIKSVRFRVERQRLSEEIRSAEQAGDWDAVRRLQEEFNTIIKG